MRNTEASVYTSPKVAKALQDVLAEANIYDGVRIGQILEAVYKQGKKDGAREAFQELEQRFAAAKRQVDHARPGRPKGARNRK